MARRLTFPNAMATLALFFSLGGVGYAATGLPSNSVGAAQLSRNAVTGEKIANGAITGAEVDRPTVGTVARAAEAGLVISAASAAEATTARSATSAAVANQVPPLELSHFVGLSGEPAFATGWLGVSGAAPVTFFKDDEGLVHLSGEARRTVGTGTLIFTLPSGFTPAASLTLLTQGGVVGGQTEAAGVRVDPNGEIVYLGSTSFTTLNGLVFRAAG